MACVQLMCAMVWTVCVGLVAGGSHCTITKYRDYYPYDSYEYHTYCMYDCCSTDCCYSGRYTTPGLTVSVWIIVGCVIAGVLVISLIIACICCCIRRQATQGQVIQYAAPTNTGQVSVVTSVSGMNLANSQSNGPSGGQIGLPYALQPLGPPSYYSLPAPGTNREQSAVSPPYPPARTS